MFSDDEFDNFKKKLSLEISVILVAIVFTIIVLLGVSILRNVWYHPTVINWLKATGFLFIVTWGYIKLSLYIDEKAMENDRSDSDNNFDDYSF